VPCSHLEFRHRSSDTGPERQTGRKAQSANIMAAKVSRLDLPKLIVWRRLTFRACTDGSGCHPNVSWTQGDVKDDLGPHGRNLVSLLIDVPPAIKWQIKTYTSWFVLQRLTNDGHAILREIDVAHPAAKSMIELSRTQDEEVGDGTTSVIILGKALALIDYHSLFSNSSCLGVFVSWRDPCPLVASARTQHPPGRHHQGLFQRPRLCSRHH
jgi:hypothetical protein